MDGSLIGALGVGFLLGLRHALEADHVAAVSAFVSQERGVIRSCLRGAFWGIGHTVALLAAGVAVVALKLRISPAFERTVETIVALLLVLLGGHVLLRALGMVSLHRHEHAHGGPAHRHLHVHVGDATTHRHVHLLRGAPQPLLMGLLHGLGGGGTLVLLVLTTLPTPATGLLYILVFGVGSTAGMLVLSGLIGIPFALTAGGSRAVATVLQVIVGGSTLVTGLLLVRGAAGP